MWWARPQALRLALASVVRRRPWPGGGAAARRLAGGQPGARPAGGQSGARLADRAREVLQPYAQYMVHAGNCILLLAVNQTDMLNMRVMMATASSLGVAYNLLQAPRPLVAPACWGAFFISSHLFNIFKLLQEKQPISLTEDEERAYNMAFMRYGYTPRQFLDLLNIASAQWHAFSKGDFVHKRGDPIEHVHYVVEGEVQLISNTDDNLFTIPAGKGGWVGEFFDPLAPPDAWQKERKHPISYACAAERCRTLSFNRREAEKFMAEDKSLAEAATRATVQDLWGKLHRSGAGARRNQYISLVQLATVDGRIDASERKVLREFRERHQISDATHAEGLAAAGWTQEDWDAGKQKLSIRSTEGLAAAGWTQDESGCYRVFCQK